MSLRGSLDTFALPDVLALLATTAKTGELHVTGAAGGGRVWVDQGLITSAEAAATTEVVDVLVHLLRLDEGDFTFHADRSAPAPGASLEVAVVLEQAGTRLSEWREVEQLLPSPGVVLTLAATAPGPVRLSREQWAAVAAIGEGRTVAELVQQLGGDELGRWRLLANLVETSLVEVGAPVTVAPVRRTELAQQLSTLSAQALAEQPEPMPEPEPEPVAEVELEGLDEVIETPDEPPVEPHEAPVPVAVATHQGDPAEGVSRGTLLKFLSSVRS